MEDQTAPEQPAPPVTDDLSQAAGHGADPVRTGVAEVDAVLASIEALEERPVSEHAEVFGAAHEQLRRALDGNG